MTLAQAGDILERFVRNRKRSLPEEVRDAITTVIPYLPRLPDIPNARTRYMELRNAVLDISGIDISEKNREAIPVIWRRCVWYRLSKEGYSTTAIGRACGFNHASVTVGINAHKDYMSTRDYQTVKIWEIFSTIIINS